MHLIYFDENKYSEENPYFTIGGVLVPEDKVQDLDRTLTQIQFNFFGSSRLVAQTEMHGKDIFHGKGNCKGRKLPDRVQLFEYLAKFVINNQIPIRLVSVDVNQHQKKYDYPTPEYRLGLMLFLARTCDYLDEQDDLGVAFGDYEKDEVASSVMDFSELKDAGKTSMNVGRSLERLIDTVYFAHSHHSRFLQLADVIVYMAGRYLNQSSRPTKWHDGKIWDIWTRIKANADMKIQHWP